MRLTRSRLKDCPSLLSKETVAAVSLRSNRQIHPLLGKAGTRLLAAVLGRFFRAKLRSAHEKDKKRYKQYMWTSGKLSLPVLGLSLYAIFYKHRRKALFTGRTQYISVPDNQLLEIAQVTEEQVSFNSCPNC